MQQVLLCLIVEKMHTFLPPIATIFNLSFFHISSVVLWTVCSLSGQARVILASTKVAVWEDRLSVDHGQPRALSLIGSAMEEA